jgi:hypothetical protein
MTNTLSTKGQNMADQLASQPITVAPPSTIPEDRIFARGWQCPRCGSSNLASAYLIDYSDKFRGLRLAPKALKIGKIARMLRPFKQLVPVSAQVCRECGAIQLEVDPDDFAEAEHKYGRR